MINIFGKFGMSINNCSNVITSEDYIDILLKYRENSPQDNIYNNISCSQNINNQWLVIHYPLSESPSISISTYGYNSIPNLYSLMDTSSLEASNITTLHTQPVLNLTGNGTIIGFIDTGIDYTHEAFKDSFGKTRILSIWDQTIEGNPPQDFLYGSEYTSEDIDAALSSSNPFNIVPSTDNNGHGTFLAGVACASPNNNFLGAAYNSKIAVVKLKEAKQYLRSYYLIEDDAIAYQENDIMLAVKYLYSISLRYRMPLAICFSLGTNGTSHTGDSPLEEYLDFMGRKDGVAIVAPTGNEGNERHHFSGRYNTSNPEDVVEIKIGDTTTGLFVEMWVPYPDTFSIEIISPLGNKVPGSSIFRGFTREYSFILEKTKVLIDYKLVEAVSGQQVITIRFIDPTPGIWRINIIGNVIVNGIYNLWLPTKGFIPNDTFFIRSSPYTTLTSPASTRRIISVGGYNHKNSSFYLDSGRGYTAEGIIKPDLVAPCVEVYGPLSNTDNQYGYKTGTSIAAALTTGVAALLLEWGLVNKNTSFMSSQDIRSYLIKGARRQPNRTYPSPEWGFGELDAYNVFVSLE